MCSRLPADIRDIVVLLEMFLLGLLAHRLYTDPSQYVHAAERASRKQRPALDSTGGRRDSRDSESECESESEYGAPALGADNYRKINTAPGEVAP